MIHLNQVQSEQSDVDSLKYIDSLNNFFIDKFRMNSKSLKL